MSHNPSPQTAVDSEEGTIKENLKKTHQHKSRSTTIKVILSLAFFPPFLKFGNHQCSHRKIHANTANSYGDISLKTTTLTHKVSTQEILIVYTSFFLIISRDRLIDIYENPVL